MQLEEDVAAFLETSGIGTVYNGSTGNIFYSRSLEAPDDAVTVRQYSGRPPDMAMGPRDVIRWPRIQIESRSLNTKTAGDKMKEVRDLFPVIFTVNSRTYAMTVLSEPSNLGEDDNHRWRTVCNFEVSIAV